MSFADRNVVTCFLAHAGRILILRRSDRVATYRGRWGAVAGGIDAGVAPLDQAFREIEEETGLSRDEVRLLAAAESFVVEDAAIGLRFHVHPMLFAAARTDVRIDWEHEEHRWIAPDALGEFDTVPMLAESLRRVRPALPEP